MRIKTGIMYGKPTRIQVETGEQLEISFNHNGNNSPVDALPTIKFTATILIFPTGQIGLSLRLPAKNLYESSRNLIVMNESNGADTITVDGHLYTKVRDLGHDDTL